MKGLEMANLLQQLMQLEMDNKGGVGGRSASPTLRPSPFGATSVGQALNLRPSPFGPITQGAPYTGMTPQVMTPPPPQESLGQPEPPRPVAPDLINPYIVEPTRPEIYPQDISPLSAVSQPSQPRTSYTQDASGNMVEIGYDGQPISSYTPEQMAIHNAVMGITPSQSQYVWNGEGYDLVPNTPQNTGVNIETGGVRLSNGQFIGGYQNPNGGMEIGTPSFFQQYAGNPELVKALSDAYGYDISNPDIVASMQRQPQIGYNEPQIGYNEPDRPVPMQGNERINDFQKSIENERGQGMMADPRTQDPRISLDNPRPPEEIIPLTRNYGY